MFNIKRTKLCYKILLDVQTIEIVAFTYFVVRFYIDVVPFDEFLHFSIFSRS